MKDDHGGVVIGSEISGGCRNVLVEDCTMDSPNLDRAFRFKSNAQRGGILENSFRRRVKIGRVAEADSDGRLRRRRGREGAVPAHGAQRGP
jgi:unsaturated rhamnogalacturonyl hydrolase